MPNSRKISIFKTLALLTFVTGSSAYLLTVHLPNQTHNTISAKFQDMGFISSSLPPPNKSFGALRYQNIILDADKFSRLEQLNIHYSPLGIVFGHKFKSIHIKGLSLTGEISETGALSIAGWHKPELIQALQKTNTESLRIENAELSLLTDMLGGITLQYDLQAQRNDQGLTLQGNITSRQKNFGFDAKTTGHIHTGGTWQLDIDMESGKLETAAIKASRLSGRAALSGRTGQQPQTVTEIRAGGISLYGFPWQNASGTLKGQKDVFQIDLDARSVDYEDMELSLSIHEDRENTDIFGTVHTQKLGHLFDYLQSRNALTLDEKTLAPHRDAENITARFFVRPHKKELVYYIKNRDLGIDIKEKIHLE